MKPHHLKSARLRKRWTQVQAAAHFGMTQAYWNLLENGKRKLTPELVQRAASVLEFSPQLLPVADAFKPAHVGDQRLADWLSQLGYPGFSHLQTRARKRNPLEVLLTALAQKSLDGRVAEALPWVALKYAQPDSDWLVQNARRFNLQNRLGFVVCLAREVAEKQGDNARSAELRCLENALDDSRLVKEDVFYRPPRTDSEKDWLRNNRTPVAAHWNLLTDIKAAHLQYGN